MATLWLNIVLNKPILNSSDLLLFLNLDGLDLLNFEALKWKVH